MSVLRIPDLSAVILAGGNSRRMGTDKALLVLQGRSLIGTIVDRVRMITDEIWISANDQFKYEFLGLPVIQDVYQGQGPLAGLHSGMRHTGRPLVLLLACDGCRTLPSCPLARGLLSRTHVPTALPRGRGRTRRKAYQISRPLTWELRALRTPPRRSCKRPLSGYL